MTSTKTMITGVHGLIGGVLYEHLAARPERYEVHGLARRREPSRRVPKGRVVAIPEERFVLSDLSDLEDVERAMRGMDVVIHMAADPDNQRGWPSLHPSNVIAAYNVFEGCRRAGVRRIVFASSIQVSFGYMEEEPYRTLLRDGPERAPAPIRRVSHTDPVRPINLYGASKVWGEALARVYAEAHGLSCLCLRIGWVTRENRPRPDNRTHDWCSYRDITDLVERCVNAPESARFDVFYGVSENRRRWVDLERAREVLGFIPQDSADKA